MARSLLSRALPAMIAAADLTDDATRAALSDAIEESGRDMLDAHLLRCGLPVECRRLPCGGLIAPYLHLSTPCAADPRGVRHAFRFGLLWLGEAVLRGREVVCVQFNRNAEEVLGARLPSLDGVTRMRLMLRVSRSVGQAAEREVPSA